MADAKPFWRGVAFWIASILVALVAGAALYWWFGDRHALTWYPMQTEISALGVDERLSLLYEGRKLPRVTVGAVELRNAGNRAVWWGAQVDPQGGINLLPPRGAELLRCAVVAQSSANIGARCTRSTVNGASIEFRLIRPGEHVRLEYAHTGGMKAFPELKAETVDCQLTMPSWPLRWLQGALAVMVLASVVTWYRTLRYSVTGAHRPGGETRVERMARWVGGLGAGFGVMIAFANHNATMGSRIIPGLDGRLVALYVSLMVLAALGPGAVALCMASLDWRPRLRRGRVDAP